jgi:hypothetical protein
VIALPTGLLKAGEDYLIALDYKVVERTEQGSFFYIFMRSLRPVEATRTIPIVFCGVSAGFVDSLARPGGNATGFLIFEYNTSSSSTSRRRRRSASTAAVVARSRRRGH